MQTSGEAGHGGPSALQDGRLRCSQLCLHSWRVPVDPHSELLRALLGESWDTRQARALMGTQRQEWAKPEGMLTQGKLREGHRTGWGGAVHIVRE